MAIRTTTTSVWLGNVFISVGTCTTDTCGTTLSGSVQSSDSFDVLTKVALDDKQVKDDEQVARMVDQAISQLVMLAGKVYHSQDPRNGE
jgi:hypothetical protein